MIINIRLLNEGDLQEADRIFRLSFGTFLGLSDPRAFSGDADTLGRVFMQISLQHTELRLLMMEMVSDL